jgi:hypothetical protein
MNSLVATCGPTSALLHAQRVVGTPDKQLASGDLLEVTLETKVRVPNCQQLGVDRTVRVVADGASFAHGFMLEHVWALLGGMAAHATVLLGHQLSSAPFVD